LTLFLAAALNPSKFLPYAAAGAAFVAFCLTQSRNTGNFFGNIMTKIGDTIMAKLTKIGQNSLGKGLGDIGKKLKEAKETAIEMGRKLFSKSLAKSMDVDERKLDLSQLDNIFNGE
jgi:hypothetical protein